MIAPTGKGPSPIDHGLEVPGRVRPARRPAHTGRSALGRLPHRHRLPRHHLHRARLRPGARDRVLGARHGVEPRRRRQHGDRAGPPRPAAPRSPRPSATTTTASTAGTRWSRARASTSPPPAPCPAGTPRSPSPWRTRASARWSPTATSRPRTPRSPDGGAPDCPPRARAAVASLTPGKRAPWIAAGRAARAPGSSPTSAGTTPARWDLAGLRRPARTARRSCRTRRRRCATPRTACPRAAAHALTEHVPLAVVTLGAEGAYAVDRRTGETAEVPAIAVEALDPTGAGDVFVAGFVTGTLAGWPLADRLAFAGLTAALSVQEFGGSLSAPGWSEIGAWWRRVREVEDQDPRPCAGTRSWTALLPARRTVRGRCGGRCRRSASGRRSRAAGAREAPRGPREDPVGGGGCESTRRVREKTYGADSAASYSWQCKAVTRPPSPARGG